jgi:hypothetical protein
MIGAALQQTTNSQRGEGLRWRGGYPAWLGWPQRLRDGPAIRGSSIACRAGSKVWLALRHNAIG